MQYVRFMGASSGDVPSHPSLPFSFPLLPSSPSCSISSSLLLFLLFFFWGLGTWADGLRLPSAIIGRTSHPAGQEITFKLGLEAMLGHGCERSVEIMGLRMVCAQAWHEQWWIVACYLNWKKASPEKVPSMKRSCLEAVV